MSKKEDVLTLTYDLVLDMIARVGKFPKDHKFMLGDRIYDVLMSLQVDMVEAYYSPKDKKKEVLARVNIQLEKLRFLIRLSKDLRCISIRQYEFMAAKVNDLGKMVGGWIKSLGS